MKLHIIQQIGKASIESVPHSVERFRSLAAYVLYRRLCVRDRPFFVVNIEVPIVLPEFAGDHADAEALPHFFLGKRDAVLVSLGGIA